MDNDARDEVIAYKPLNQIVFERLHGDILRGALRPGDPLRQEEITERLGVSRTPVREAIRRLQAEGLVTFSPRKGATVAEIPLKKVREIYQIRGQLEAFAAELAIDHLNAKDLAGLRKLITEMEALDPERDLEKILDKNRKFHYVIYSASGNDTLVEMIDQLWRDIQRLRSRYLLTPHGHRHSTSEHLSILKALEARDHARLRELVRQHCERAQHSLTARSADGQP